MRKIIHFVTLLLSGLLFFSACKGPEFLLKKDVQIDTLHLELDLRIVQDYDYKQEILQKMTKFVEVYNSETHPFKLALNTGSQTTACMVKVVRVKFVHSKENVWGTVVSAAGIGTAAALIATGFPVPFGWVYIPSARTTMTPVLSNDLTEVNKFQHVGISSVGMYVKLGKQRSKQSTKFVKYMVSVVQTVEQEYKMKKRES